MSDIESKKIWWHSRRGMLELDLVLLPFVEQRYPLLETGMQLNYRSLLEEEDQDLYRWLIGKDVPSDPALANIVNCIRQFILPPPFGSMST